MHLSSGPKRDVYGRMLKLLSVPVPASQVRKVYYYAGAQMVAMREISGTTGASTLYYLHSDHLGSTSLVTNASGGFVSRRNYYTYGGVRVKGSLHRYHVYGPTQWQHGPYKFSRLQSIICGLLTLPTTSSSTSPPRHPVNTASTPQSKKAQSHSPIE